MGCYILVSPTLKKQRQEDQEFKVAWSKKKERKNQSDFCFFGIFFCFLHTLSPFFFYKISHPAQLTVTPILWVEGWPDFRVENKAT